MNQPAMKNPRWVLGAPFDVVTLDEACERIRSAVRHRERLIFVTPNVAFVAEAARNPRFHQDILRTDLSLADGAPIVWLGRLAGIPFVERVAGSDVLESLEARSDGPPLRVFFFGGEAGASEAAMQATNARGGGLLAVGAHYPGFVSVEQMSDAATIDLINQSHADFLVVALGAAKGHRWIEMNRHKLNVPVISHLGAAVNFAAGRLQRAPRFLQRVGLEWLWRIKEEPALFQRYARDSWFLCWNAAGFMRRERLQRRRVVAASPIVVADDSGMIVATVEGAFREQEVRRLEQALSRSLGDVAKAVRLVFKAVTRFDASSVGWIYAMTVRSQPSRMSATFDFVSRRALEHWRAGILAAEGSTRASQP